MLQLNYLRDHREAVIQRLKHRFFLTAEEDVDRILAFDRKRRQLQLDLDTTQARSNALSKEIGQRMKEGNQEAAESARRETAELKQRAREWGEELATTEKALYDVLVTLPNLPHASVPAGRTAEENEVVLQHGTLPDLPETALPHWDLVKQYDRKTGPIVDFELGTKITGAGFPVYKGKGARIQRALVNFFLDEAQRAGYVEIQPPLVINRDSGFGTGQLPDKDGQMYHIPEEDFFLIPTAEVPITNLYRDVILASADLPVKHVGYTPCFRREAGSWGAHVRGLNRLHQFDKVEIVQVCQPEHSYAVLEEMSQYVQGLLRKLELPYRVLRLCGGDMGFTAALTYDMEVYSAAQKRWLEVSSISNFETYQANRLKLRYKVEGKTQLLHTLNGSALALPRVLAAILENNQTSEGILLPKILQPYAGFEKID
ncbi:MAG: serine--tRNA ligase [Ferruginibacter sp.]|nr:serine--tRNA ligase [Cytophagales bacterium]